jgi:hypothetical protein
MGIDRVERVAGFIAANLDHDARGEQRLQYLLREPRRDADFSGNVLERHRRLAAFNSATSSRRVVAWHFWYSATARP